MTTRKVQPRINGGDINRLNPMQRMFVEELLADVSFNASKAARKAGYKKPSLQASKLLAQPTVRAIIGKALRQRIERCQLTADEVLEHLRTALFLDPLDLFVRRKDGSYEIKNLDEVPVEVRRCITKLKQRVKIVDGEPETYVEVDLMSKDSALVNAMKHLGLIALDNSQRTIVNVGTDVVTALIEQVEANPRNPVIDASYIESVAGREDE